MENEGSCFEIWDNQVGTPVGTAVALVAAVFANSIRSLDRLAASTRGTMRGTTRQACKQFTRAAYGAAPSIAARGRLACPPQSLTKRVAADMSSSGAAAPAPAALLCERCDTRPAASTTGGLGGPALLCPHCRWSCARCGCTEAGICRVHAAGGFRDTSLLPSAALSRKYEDTKVAADTEKNVMGRCECCRSSRGPEHKARNARGPDSLPCAKFRAALTPLNAPERSRPQPTFKTAKYYYEQ